MKWFLPGRIFCIFCEITVIFFRNIVILHNGVRSEYTAPLNDGDDIKIFWE